MNKKINLQKLTEEQLVKIIKTMGMDSFNVEQLKENIKKGSPVNSDGTINIIDYCAWLISKGAGS